MESIINKIKEDAEREGQRIESDMTDTVGRKIREAEQEAAGIILEAEKRSRSRARELKERMLTAMGLENRNQLLSEKQQLIQEAFKHALKSLETLPDNRYREIIKKLLLAIREVGEVIVSPKDTKRFNNEFLAEVNRELAGRRKGSGKLQFSQEQREMRGGFILRRGKQEINASFESILQERQEELETELERILFK
ncbi:MAG: hypothetical protein JSU92_09585 [Deltaproteobacteria bacterium]|nr:MAG: hypothetical protein JSU92_09585 [Deltaproteobacteria bacterium]